MKSLKAALIAALLAGTVCLCGCELPGSDGSIDDVYEPLAAEEAESSHESDTDDQRGRAIKGFRDMIADKYGEADNSGENSEGSSVYDTPEPFVE
jgi:hypothetical protein